MAKRVEHRQEEAAAATLRRAAQIGNSGDVVPVDAMAKAKRECRQNDPQTHTFVYRLQARDANLAIVMSETYGGVASWRGQR